MTPSHGLARVSSFWKTAFCLGFATLILAALPHPASAKVLVGTPCAAADLNATQLDTDRKNLLVCLEDKTESYSWHPLNVPPSASPPCENGNVAMWNIATSSWTCDEAKSRQCIVRNQVGTLGPCEASADVYCNAREVVTGGGAVAMEHNDLLNNFPLTDDQGGLIGWRGNIKLPEACQESPGNEITAYVVCCH